MEQRFLSTLSLRRATDVSVVEYKKAKISIHALLAESDRCPCYVPHRIRLISIHALLAESDDILSILIIGFLEFLSTLSLRRATSSPDGSSGRQEISIHALLAESDCPVGVEKSFLQDFYPRSPCGERLNPIEVPQYHILISIHALLAESDRQREKFSDSGLVFLSTLSLRRATHYDNYNLHCVEISIHALLAESDCTMTITICTALRFLSTLSLRRATTRRTYQQGERQAFLSTLSLRRATRGKVTGGYDRNDFYPRSPCGERLNGVCLIVHIGGFLSTLSLRRATRADSLANAPPQISIHALLAESDLNEQEMKCKMLISIHALLAESDLD